MSKFNEILLAYLALISGLAISGVAVYYSVVGLTAIFAAAALPIIIMGITLEVGKLVATVWLKQNWAITPKIIKIYLISAIILLMIITSMGIFGFLSKSHSDQNLIGGEVLVQLAIYDEKIKTTKENIETKRRELKQMDEAVDQVMARSQNEQGADKSIALRKSQQRDRTRISSEIETEQKRLSELNNEAAPIRAQVRQVEAEVGPLKYIAAFIYGETDQSVLEKSVTWVIVLLIVVFDPLAIILLLASQISFQNLREKNSHNELTQNTNLIATTLQTSTTTDIKNIQEESTVVNNLESFDPWQKNSNIRSNINLNISRKGGDFLNNYFLNMVENKIISINDVPPEIKSDIEKIINEKQNNINYPS